MAVKKHKRAMYLLLLIFVFCAKPVWVFALDEASVVIPVTCIGKQTDEVFTVILDFDDAGHQKADKTVLELKDGEEGQFTVTYSVPGTYHYQISQRKGADALTKYDDTVYLVDVYVTEDEAGHMSAEPVVYLEGQSGKKGSVSFVNERGDGSVLDADKDKPRETESADASREGKTGDGVQESAAPRQEKTDDDGKGMQSQGTTQGTTQGMSQWVKTGDDARVSFYLCLAAGGAAALLITAKTRKEHQKHEERKE